MKYRSALLYAACGVAVLCSIGSAMAQNATATTNPPAYQTQGSTSLSQTMTGGLRVQPMNGGADVTPSNPSPTASYLSPTLSVPSSTLTRPANTTAYAGSSATPQLVASSTTAGSIVVPSFAIGTSGGQAMIPLVTLSTNVTTGWGNVALLITLWTAAPTYSTGDGGTYTPATGAARATAQYACVLTQVGDGAWCTASPVVGNAPILHPASGAAIFWDIQIQSSATPISGQTFTLKPQLAN